MERDFLINMLMLVYFINKCIKYDLLILIGKFFGCLLLYYIKIGNIRYLV